MTSSSPPDMEEIFASFNDQDSDLLEGISTDEQADSGNEVEIVKELKTSLVAHQCDLCCEGTFLVNKILQFGGAVTDRKKHGCNICCKGFGTKSDLSSHMKLHETGMLNSDSEIEYNRLNVLRAATKKTFICEICSTKCKSHVGLRRHMTNQHKKENSFTHQCEVCMATFNDFRKFTHHCSTHEQKKKLLVCSTCNKKFLWRRNLLKHTCSIE